MLINIVVLYCFVVGAISEQVDNHKSGYLVRAGDNKKFADILKKAMNLNIDEYNAMSRMLISMVAKSMQHLVL